MSLKVVAQFSNVTPNSCTIPNKDIKAGMYAVAVPIIVIICILVMVTNGAVLWASRRVKSSSKDHPTLPLTLSLASSDLWTSVITASSLVYNSYLFYIFDIRADACVSLTIEAVRMGGFITGSLHLLFIAVIHYLTLKYPTTYQNFLTPRTNWAITFLIWLCPPGIILVFLASLPGQFFQSPYDPCHGYCQKFQLWQTFEFRLVIFFAFFAPFILTSLLYVMFLLLLRRQEKKFSRPIPAAVSTSLTKHKTRRQQLQKSRRTFVTTVLIWITFFLGWIPSCALFILTCATCPFPVRKPTLNDVRVMFVLGVIGNLFILFKSFLNPIIYAIRIPEIKLALYKQYGFMAEVFYRLIPSENHVGIVCHEENDLVSIGGGGGGGRAKTNGNESQFESVNTNQAIKNTETYSHQANIEKLSPRENDNLLKK